jgi:hypothetical protein
MSELTGNGGTIQAEEIASAIKKGDDIYLKDITIEGDFILADISEEEFLSRTPCCVE